jgi:hypothetical protein
MKKFLSPYEQNQRLRVSWHIIKEKMAKIPRFVPRAWGLAKRLRYLRKQK